MPQSVIDLLNLFLRWAHVVAGITWIGHLYFFNWVNGPMAKALDGATKKAVVPELMPRALFWFRWGAAWTWITGLLLGGLLYYHGRQAFEDPTAPGNNPWLWLAIVIVIAVVGFLIYNVIMNSIANVVVASALALVVFAAVYLFLEYVGKFGGRSLYIHTGLFFGPVMAANVWMVIWPAQRKIITATKEGTAPDAALVAKAGLRSRQNTYMSVPLVFTMISNHFPTMYGQQFRDICLAGVIALGFVVTRMLYGKAGKVPGF
jgi:uncharacterized membrane protein